MSHFSATNVQWMLYAGYVLCFIALNVIAFLISLFYRRKLQQPSPRIGFFLAIALAVLYGGLMFGERNGSAMLQGAAYCALSGSALASLFSMLRLFSVMRKVRK